MKMFPNTSAIVVAALAWALPCVGQKVESEKIVSGPVSTGKVALIDRGKGTLVIQSDQTGGMVTFFWMDKARVETSAGNLATFANVQPNMAVTVEYTPKEGRWYVGRVIIPAPPTAVTAGTELTSSEQKALASKVANDGDITTKPGVKARIDNDITTQPGKKDPRDPDITKKTDR